MPRPPTPKDCHKPTKYITGDKIWYLRHGKWRKGKVAEQAGSSDGAKRWLITDSKDGENHHAIEDDMRKEGSK